MKRKNYYLIWCGLFIFLLLPTQFGCNKTEFELQPEQTNESDFERVEHQEQIGDGNAVYYWNNEGLKAEKGGPVPWDIKYKADALPASPWYKYGGGSSVSDGVLHTPYSCTYVNKNINFSNGTLEFRMRVGDNSGAGSMFLCNNNDKCASFRIYPGGPIFFRGVNNTKIYNYDGTEFHNYRITLTDTEIKLYIDGELIVTDEPMQENASTCISFGQRETLNGIGNSYWDYVYFTDNGAYVPVPTLLAEGDKWVLLNNDYDWPDYDEQTIYDHLTWAGKTVAKKSVANYWVKKKLLGDNIAKFFAKKVGVSGIIKYLFMNLPIVGDADEVKQVWVRESDGYTAIKDAGSTYHVDKYYGYFETATLIHHGDQHFDYKFIIYHGTVKIATAILLHEHCGIASSTMLIWDFDFRMNAPLDFYSIELRRKSPGEPDSEYVHYKSSIVQRYN